MQDAALKSARDRFFDGEGPLPSSTVPQPHRRNASAETTARPLTADEMLNRIDPRLRRVVVRACRNSYAAARVVELFEACILAVFRGDNALLLSPSPGGAAPSSCWWSDLLLRRPTVNTLPSRRSEEPQGKEALHYRAEFLFHATSPTGGFHRLLLQAVCQFHRLHAVSRMLRGVEIVATDGRASSNARALIVSGALPEGEPRFRLLQHLNDQQQQQSGDATSVRNVNEQMSALRV